MSHLASSSLNNLTFSHGVDASSSAEWPVLIPNGVLSHGTTVHTRRGQPLPLSIAGEETVFVVRMATLLFRLTLPGDLRQGAGVPPRAQRLDQAREDPLTFPVDDEVHSLELQGLLRVEGDVLASDAHPSRGVQPLR